VAAVVEAALELLRKHLPPALLIAAAPSSSSSSTQSQQQQAQQRLTRVVLGASGFQVCVWLDWENWLGGEQIHMMEVSLILTRSLISNTPINQEAAAPLHGSITRFLRSSGAKGGGGGAGGGGQPQPPPPSPSAAAATRDATQHAVVVGGSNGNTNNKGQEEQKELTPALRAAGYDPEVWRALPADVRRELLLASSQGGQLLPLPVPVPSSNNKRAAAPGVGGSGGGKRSKSSPPKRKRTGGGKAAAPLTRFFKPKGTAGGKEG
jgi:hypothetical protein